MPPEPVTRHTADGLAHGIGIDPAGDERARKRLRRNRALANGLLASMAAIAVGTHLVENPGFATLLVRAGAEAGVVGGLADWFAVTALFRHPLGIPVPHTAIIPRSRDRIAKTIGGFIERHFLTTEVVLAKLNELQLGRRFAIWLGRSATAAAIANAIADALPYVIQSLSSKDLISFAQRTLGEQLRQADITPILSRVIEAMAKSGEADVVFDHAIGVAEKLLMGRLFRLKGPVGQGLADLVPFASELLKGGVKIGGLELVPDIGLGNLGGVDQVGFIEAVIAQVIEQQLVGREIIHRRVLLLQLAAQNPQQGLAHAVAFQGLFQVPHRAQGQEQAQARVKDLQACLQTGKSLLHVGQG